METFILSVTLPTCWQELSPKQLNYVYWMLSEGFSSVQLRVYALFRWAPMEVLDHDDHGNYCVRYQGQVHQLYRDQVTAAIDHLSWLDQLPLIPIRPAKIVGGKDPLPADFQGVPFQTFLYCDNLYQGWLRTRRETLLWQLAAVLYQSDKDELVVLEEETVAVFYWFASLKQFLARQFPHFFTSSPASEPADEQALQRQMQEAMNTQIRALTKGDITKEDVVLNADTWRALAELDAQAKEYEELKKQANK